mmetsp:Transcript_3822/g.7174  ORF Transcript_3822/g.7174 Transcript_3822/m.7174 type:complete len:250 (-) Transcript_3822:529-1278(-)
MNKEKEEIGEGPDLEAGIPQAGDEPAPDVKPLAMVKNVTPKEMVIYGIAAGDVGVSLTALFLHNSPATILAGLLSLIVSPMVAVSQRELTEIETLRETHEKLAKEFLRYAEDNKKLNAEISQMRETADRLESLQENLKLIAEVEGRSMEELSEQLEEMKTFEKRIKGSTNRKILHHILECAVTIDDGDGIISPQEGEKMRKTLEETYGIELYEEKFMETLGKRNSISSFMTSIRRAIDSDELVKRYLVN